MDLRLFASKRRLGMAALLFSVILLILAVFPVSAFAQGTAPPGASALDPKATTAAVALIVGITQLLKWFGLRDRMGALAVMVLALLLTFVQLVSFGWGWEQLRPSLMDVISLWALLATSAAGVFGFTRAAADAVTAASSPPPGAAQSPTLKL